MGSAAERVETRYYKLQEGWNEKYSTLGRTRLYPYVIAQRKEPPLSNRGDRVGKVLCEVYYKRRLAGKGNESWLLGTGFGEGA